MQREGLPGHPGFKDIKDRFALRPGHARAAKDIGFDQMLGFRCATARSVWMARRNHKLHRLAPTTLMTRGAS